jgi:phosphatidylinositol dimannoside acyltransferase
LDVAVDSDFWRKAAAFGARRGPPWFLRYSPPVIGLAFCAALPHARHAVLENLIRVRGDKGTLRNAIDVARTFATFAGCLGETLAAGSANDKPVHAVLEGAPHFFRAHARGRGLILATSHTGGWEATGKLLTDELNLPVLVAMQRERDDRARARQDRAREASGIKVAHVGSDPLEALPLLTHLKAKGAVALQVDRTPPGMRTRDVKMFGGAGKIPEGVLKLAQISGAPIVPVFSARLGFRRYLVSADPPIELARRSSDQELDRAAQMLATSMERFVKAHPTQWLSFEPLTADGSRP